MKKTLFSIVFVCCMYWSHAPYSLTFKDINPTGDASPLSLNPQGFLNGKMYFNANDGVNGFSLWETDGSIAGTKLTAPVYADKFLNYNNKLYFRGGFNSDLYVTDGTLSGTKAVSPSAAKNPFASIVFDGKIFYGGQFGGSGAELWVSDGTDTATHLFKDINTTGNDPGVYYSMIVYNGKLYFEGDNGTSGRELFVCDGTPTGTSLLKDIYAGPTGSFPRDLTIFNGKLYFTADNGTNGAELWVTDGTTAGTQMLKDIYVRTNGARAYTYGITLYNNKLYFAAQDAATGIELWQTDGTSSGTTMVADFFAGTIGSDPRFITVYQNKLFFSAYTSAGVELCVSDGTNAGTQLFKDINTFVSGVTPYGSSPWSLTGRAAPVLPGPGPACWVKADRRKFFQAVGNVISNAYKYSPGGGPVEVGLVDDGTRVGLQVRDHGIGMTPRQQARVCERFYRADASGSIPGTGLGMSIVKEIILLHDGEVDIDSTPGVGSCVTLWLPRGPGDEGSRAEDDADAA